MARRLLLGLIRFYRFWLSPWFGGQCRFHPTCSDYCLQCIQIYPLFKAIRMSCWRLLRCQPFADGGSDPVPKPGTLI
ncbi:MAG TPA: membrane protein insertion efficiency factor YidD [Gammaproteobacteria bacterium]|nr:membrane protein insertion efficiency factor YidD [Gammaproteobacteria bacterium]